MGNRKLFPKLGLFKKEVTELFLEILRNLYEPHPVYDYNKNEMKSNILIYPSYANIEKDGYEPRIIAKASAYNLSLTDTFFNNMKNEVVVDNMVVGYEYSQIIPISLTLLVHAYNEEESSDVADELASLIIYAKRNSFEAKGLKIRSGQVSETDLFNNEQGVYQTVVTISLEVPWLVSTYEYKPVDEIEVDVELDTEGSTGPYRQPGVDVFREFEG